MAITTNDKGITACESNDIEDDIMSTEDDDSSTSTINQFRAKAKSLASTKNMFSVKKGKPSVVKKRKRRKNKPKDYPKRPLSSYNIFFKETREKILTEHGKTNFKEMVRKIAALWKEITPEDKLKFDAIASRDLARYKGEVGVYERNLVEKIRVEDMCRVEMEKLSTKEQNKNHFLLGSTDPSSVSTDATSYQQYDNDEKKSSFPVENVQIPKVTRDPTMAPTSQGLANNNNSNHTLSSGELQVAQSRLEQELSAIEELQSLRKLQVEMSCIHSVGGSLSNTTRHENYLSGGSDKLGNRLNSSEVDYNERRNLHDIPFGGRDNSKSFRDFYAEKRQSLGLSTFGGDFESIENELKVQKRASQATVDGDAALVSIEKLKKRLLLEGDAMAINDESKIGRIGRDVNTKGPWNGLGLRKQLGLGTNLLAASHQTSHSEKNHTIREELRNRLTLDASNTESNKEAMDIIRNHFADSQAEVRSRAVIINDRGPIATQLDRPVGNIRIENIVEARIREEERIRRLRSFFHVKTSRSDLSELNALRSSSASGDLVAPNYRTSQPLNYAGIRTASMQSQMSLLRMGRMFNTSKEFDKIRDRKSVV